MQYMLLGDLAGQLTAAPLSRTQKLGIFGEAVFRRPWWSYIVNEGRLRGIEFMTPEKRNGLSTHWTFMQRGIVALRRAGVEVESNTYGALVRALELSPTEAHEVFCDCNNIDAMECARRIELLFVDSFAKGHGLYHA